MIPAKPLAIAQITDIHLFADTKKELLGLPTEKSFHAVLEQLQKLLSQLDILLLTGDLSQDGKAESYQRLAELLSPLSIPTYWVPGNHDQPLVMQQVLKEAPISPEKSFAAGDWQFLLLDSHVSGCVHGKLSPESLVWLDTQLKLASDRPILIGFHHPPFLVDSDWLDGSTLQNPEELFAVIDRHPQVKLVIFGHIHQEFYQRRGGVHYLGSPSTSIQFEPHSHNFSLDKVEPGFRLLNLYPDGSFETRVQRVTYVHELDLAATGY
ncbi:MULTISPECIES: 3',5'-cyclic-AMP phosphodiesterase [Cyanophyceae]|uniref:3',5'-cyclic-AMP phosphodiesterase n=1 Tax=Cyanophyceae TaxID=3028117 RepID=UPI00168548F1|nr:3',5'-cyclic-AMP phosphodiesterase [Trichocoleus sp. FACHB-69]MBD1935427.1 3',5'-cyclic-AMP phosphodiesterase [Trichocoleus sp. FACHB-69]